MERHISQAKSNTTYPLIVIAALSMKDKFDKYWRQMERFATIAIVFDPRYKIEFLQYHFLSELKLSRLITDLKISKIKEDLYQYYSSYTPKPDNTIENTSTNTINPLDDDDEDTNFKDFLATSKGTTKNPSPTAELDLYLQEPKIEVANKKDFQVLDWWKANDGRLSHLAEMAKKILMTTVTSVASELAFSTGGCILDDFRSNLKTL
jgi:hypothetical protein